MGNSPSAAQQNSIPEACPMHDKANPLNNIPANLDTANRLSPERTISSIPRASQAEGACPVVKSDDQNWVYPSPQQFQNALNRKNKGAPEESVDMMVQIHNWMNEQAWQQVRQWEESRAAFKGDDVQLARFTGRPEDLSPKARYHIFLSKLFPSVYSGDKPFDRHDWYVRRPTTNVTQRYVIDYYSCPDDEQGNPVFSLDVRPALDNPDAVGERITEWARQKKARFFEPEKQEAR